jgi:hypothetical protein
MSLRKKKAHAKAAEREPASASSSSSKAHSVPQSTGEKKKEHRIDDLSPYDQLGVSKTSSLTEIRKSFHIKGIQWHPVSSSKINHPGSQP